MNQPHVTTTIRMQLSDRATFDVLRNRRAEKNGGRRPTMQALLEEAVAEFLRAISTSSGHPSSRRLDLRAFCSEICSLVATLTHRARRAQGSVKPWLG